MLHRRVMMVTAAIDQAMIDKIYQDSVRLDSEGVVYFCLALSTVSAMELDKALNPRVFGPRKIVEVACDNISLRIPLVWQRIWQVLAPRTASTRWPTSSFKTSSCCPSSTSWAHHERQHPPAHRRVHLPHRQGAAGQRQERLEDGLFGARHVRRKWDALPNQNDKVTGISRTTVAVADDTVNNLLCVCCI